MPEQETTASTRTDNFGAGSEGGGASMLKRQLPIIGLVAVSVCIAIAQAIGQLLA